MGVIQIRQRTERLGNLPGVMRADVRTGGAEALAAQARQTGADGAARAGLVGDALKGAGALFGIAAKIAERKESEEATAAANAYMREKRAEYYGTSDENGNFVAGRLQRGIDDPGGYVADAQKYDADLKERHFGRLPRRAREMAERAVAGLDLQTQNAVVGRAGREWQARRVSAADEALRLQSQGVLDLPELADAGMRASAWGAWNDAVERALDVRGVGDPSARREFRRRNAEALVGAALERQLQEASERTSGLDPDKVDEAFGDISDRIAECGWRGVVAGDIENGQGETVADWLGDDLKGSDEKAMSKALSDRVASARRHAVAEARAAEREAQAAVVREFTERECAMDKDVVPENWAETYENWGNDETLRKADPKRARDYRDAAAKMREAERKSKEKASVDAIKANEDRIYGRLIDFIYAKKLGYLSGKAAADEQAAIWRDFRVAAMGKAVGKDFPDRFTARLDKELNEQQAEAMRYTMQLFGYDAETDSRGRVGAAERNKATNDGLTFKTPFKVEGWFGDSQPTISASQLFDVLDRQWRLLDGQDKGGNRLEAAKKMAEGAKEQWLHGGYDGMIEGMADAFMRNEVDRRSGEEYREAE